MELRMKCVYLGFCLYLKSKKNYVFYPKCFMFFFFVFVECVYVCVFVQRKSITDMNLNFEKEKKGQKDKN